MTVASEDQFPFFPEVGRSAVTPNGTTITPVLATFPDSGGPLALPELLDRYIKATGGRPLPAGVDEFYGHFDAVWVRGRLPIIFEYAPMQYSWGDRRFAFLNEAFLARPRNGGQHLFVCTDAELRVRLLFDSSTAGPDVRSTLAAAFWELLLAGPNEVAEYNDYFVLDDGGGELICNAAYRAGCFSVDVVAELNA